MNLPSSLRHRLAAAFSILVLASLACSLPGGLGASSPSPLPTDGANQPTQAKPTASLPTAKAVTTEKLPPALVETDPPQGSRVGNKKPVTFYFNQAMDRASVESAIKGDSTAGGKFEWLDDATMRFTSDQVYPAATAIKFTIDASAKAANGLALQNAIQADFESAGPLKVAERLPKPGAADADPSSAVIVTFTEPVVDLGTDAGNLTPAFSLQPEASGKGSWINTSTYVFYPQPALKGGITYSVKLNAQLASTQGASLNLEGLDPADWSFVTAPPKMSSVKWTTGLNLARAELDPTITVTFNQPMDQASVEQNLHLVGPAGVVLAGKYKWNDTFTIVEFKPDTLLGRDIRYTVQLLAAAKGQGGTALEADQTIDFFTLPALGVASTNPAQGTPFFAGYGLGTVVINFTAPLDKKQDLTTLISVEPAVSDLQLGLSEDGYDLVVSGGFNPSTRYDFHLSGALQDRWGMKLSQDTTVSLTSDAVPPSFNIIAAQVSGQTIFMKHGENTLEARATNLKTLDIEVGKLDPQTFYNLSSYISGQNAPALHAVYHWQMSVQTKADTNQPFALPVTPDGSSLEAGLYYMKVTSPELGQNAPPPYLLVISHYQISLKKGPAELTLWAANLDSLSAQADARLSIYTNGTQKIGECQTDANGLCRIDLPKDLPVDASFIAMTGTPGKPDFGLASSQMTSGLGTYLYGVSGASEDRSPLVYLYTDRPIYRPGQTVNFRAVLRARDNGRYSTLDLKELDLKVALPYDPITNEQPTLTELHVPVSGYGTVNGSFDLPKSAQVGYYSLIASNISQPVYLSFQVAEYRKPQFEISAAFSQEDYLPSDALKATVSAAYYFGAPTSSLPVSWVLYTRNDRLYLPDGLETGTYDAFWLSSFDTRLSGLGTYVTQGTGVTGADGKLEIEISKEMLAKIDPQLRQTLTLEVNASDESNQPIAARGSAIFHPANFEIGLRAEAWGTQAGTETGFGVQTVDWQSQPSGNHALSAAFSKVVWVRSDPEPGTYGEPSYKQQFTPVATTDLRTDGLGRARITFTPPDPGVYQLEVRGEGALTRILIWVGGPGIAPWPSLPDQRLQIEADAAEYSVGQTAKIRIPNPYSDKALVLVTVERSRVMYQHVFELSTSMAEESISVDALYAPNAYVSVTVLGNKDDGAPDFRQGYLNLPVKADAFKLNLEVKPSTSRALPGQEMSLDLTVRDAQDKPVQGEFSLALVDKAVLALADSNAESIFDAFYGQQSLGIVTSMDLASYANRVATLKGGRGGGGGDSSLAAQAAARSNFQDTAVWYGTIETGTDGKASIQVKLPDNLTTWVADLRGLTADTKIGEASVEIVTSKDLLLRPVAPRFLVAGDHFQLAAIVQNNTDSPQHTLVTLEAAGLTFDTADNAQTVDVPAHDRRSVSWGVTVQTVDSVDPLFSASAGDLSDSTRLESGPLPVLRYKSPQTYGTAGLLAEGGQKLEVVSLPHSFTPTGGQLSVELTPSLAASVLLGLKSLDSFPDEGTEQFVSKLLPNLATYQAFKKMSLKSPELEPTLSDQIHNQMVQLLQLQNDDGGFSWAGRRTASEAYLSSYVLFTFNEATRAGFLTNEEPVARLSHYLAGQLSTPDATTPSWRLDQMSFTAFAIGDSSDQQDAAILAAYNALYPARERLSPWAKALLALGIQKAWPDQSQNLVKTLVSDLESSATRNASGASWEQAKGDWHTWSTSNFVTAVSLYALARLDPAAPVITDAVRHLVLNRQASGGWQSSYETAWSLLAIVQAMQSTGDLQANFAYQASLNGTQIAAGNPQTPATALTPVTAQIPLSQLSADSPNALRIQREAGEGRLYYRAFLEVDRPAESAPAIENGLSVRREYFRAGEDCAKQTCTPITQAELGKDSLVLVHVTVVLPQDMYYLVVEDTVPAGMQIIDPNLKTSLQGQAAESGPNSPEFKLSNPQEEGWGWWYFGQAQIRDQGVRWVAPYLPAGTYTLTYRLVPSTAGEFRVIPAMAYENYFPDVQGTSAGSVFLIK
jgi:alpha-2-macroglobulin